MSTYLIYVLRRLGQFVLVVFIGINVAFFITHAAGSMLMTDMRSSELEEVAS